jgi:DNA-binding protein HU-beta
MLNRKSFIDLMADINDTKKVEAEKALDQVLNGIVAAVSEGEDLTLLGYFQMKIKDVAESTRPNPQNRDEKITTPAHRAVKFKSGSMLNDIVNN